MAKDSEGNPCKQHDMMMMMMVIAMFYLVMAQGRMYGASGETQTQL